MHEKPVDLKHVLKGWLVDNVVTADNKEDKILALDTRGSVTLSSAEGTVTKLAADMVPRNNPSELMLLIPAGTAAGTYTLTVTTQYCGGGTLLKEPRSVSREIVVGE